MLIRTSIYFCILLISGMFMQVSGQTETPKPKRNADDPLIFKSILNKGDVIQIEYSIPFEGVVGFELMDAEEKLVWRNQYVNKAGDNLIKFGTKPLTEGKYFYSLFYKGNETRKYFDYRATN